MVAFFRNEPDCLCSREQPRSSPPQPPLSPPQPQTQSLPGRHVNDIDPPLVHSGDDKREEIGGGHISQYYGTRYEIQRQTGRPRCERNVRTCRKGNGKDQIALNAAQTGFKAQVIQTAEVEDCPQISIDWRLLPNTCASHRSPPRRGHGFAPGREIVPVFSVRI